MATYNLKDDVDRKLRKMAEQQHRAPEEILAEMIEQKYDGSNPSLNDTGRVNGLLKMALRAEELGLSSGRSDISENFDEVLREVMAEKSEDRQIDNKDG